MANRDSLVDEEEEGQNNLWGRTVLLLGDAQASMMAMLVIKRLG